MSVVDSEFGRYDSESRMVKLMRGPWHCRVCNAVKTRVGRDADGNNPLCPVCQARAAQDAAARPR